MYVFLWYTCISYLILFTIISGCIYFYTKERSFKYYILYNLFLILYLLTKEEHINNVLHNYLSKNFLQHFNWLIQVFFYSLYFIFALYFLDFHKHKPVIFKKVRSIFFGVIFFFTFFASISIPFNLYNLFFNLFTFGFLPLILVLFLYFFPLSLKYSGKHKYFLLTGIIAYIIFALYSFLMSYLYYMGKIATVNALNYFFTGLIIESICFSLGLAYKIKLINDESVKQKNEQLKTRHQLEITKLNALIEGEEKERNRIAQDLHDGINGDLSAIKFQLMAFKNQLTNDVGKENLDKSIAMIDTTCEQVRTISHNLTPYTISQYGLSVALEQFCNKMNHAVVLIDYQWFGEELVLPKNMETGLYRIVQELVQNAIKHAKAKEILVYCNNLGEFLNITIEDDGVGFDENKQTKGIGLINIEKRVNYLNAKMEIESSNQGTTILISIPLKTNNYDFNSHNG